MIIAAKIRFGKISEVDRLPWTFAILAIAAVAYVYAFQLNMPPIRSDGLGYQAYLPALLIDQDLTFKTYGSRLFDGAIPDWLVFVPNVGNYLNKYPIGTALLQSPFFLIADAVSILFGFERSGVSLPYQIANVVSAIFYFLLGTRVIYVTLRDHIEGSIARITIWVVAFGTNVFHYATYDGCFSHIYSFALIALFVRLSLRYYATPAIGVAALDGAILGLIIITRLNNGIVGLIALGVWIHVGFGANCCATILRDGFVFLLCAVIAISPQLLYWYSATGHFLIYSYGNEGFIWTQPHLVDFLFSIKKGLLFWSPVLFVSLMGFFVMPQKLRLFGVLAFICITIHVYVCSSWHMWWFGGGYGSRPFADMTGILALPMAAGFSFIVSHSSIFIVRTIAGLTIGVNLILMNGYWIGFVPFEGPTANELFKLPQRYYEILTKLPKF